MVTAWWPLASMFAVSCVYIFILTGGINSQSLPKLHREWLTGRRCDGYGHRSQKPQKLWRTYLSNSLYSSDI